MSDMKDFMPRVVFRVYAVHRLPRFLFWLGKFIVASTVAAFVLTLAFLAFNTPYRALGFAVVCGVPFLIVSVIRRFFNAKRPSEVYDFSFDGFLGKNKKGRSFPSRHVFSSFVIGTALSFYVPIAGIILCILGACLGACRVLLGIHFVRDVVAGALIGIASGIIGHLIVNIGLLSIV